MRHFFCFVVFVIAAALSFSVVYNVITNPDHEPLTVLYSIAVPAGLFATATFVFSVIPFIAAYYAGLLKKDFPLIVYCFAGALLELALLPAYLFISPSISNNDGTQIGWLDIRAHLFLLVAIPGAVGGAAFFCADRLFARMSRN